MFRWVYLDKGSDHLCANQARPFEDCNQREDLLGTTSFDHQPRSYPFDYCYVEASLVSASKMRHLDMLIERLRPEEKDVDDVVLLLTCAHRSYNHVRGFVHAYPASTQFSSGADQGEDPAQFRVAPWSASFE